MIRISGILQKQYANKLQEVFDIYVSRSVDYHPKRHVPILFRRSFAVEEVTQIKFIGVWDTVGALGNPLPMKTLLKTRNEFHDTELSSCVENAFHALAIDERRKAFYPTLWHKQKTRTHQVMEQSWFLGGHFDVGGGNLETGLSDISLQWMLEKAQGCNLKFNQLDIKPDPMGKIHFINKRDQYNPRYSRPIKVGWQGSGDTNELIHSSVIERYRNDPTYRPKNLVDYFKRYPIQLET
jgi:uncharacterized protein (DUF2235 family)